MARRLLALIAAATFATTTPACSRITRHFGGGGGAPTRKGTLTVSPASGGVGTAFSLNAGGFKPGEPMNFEIDIRGRPPFRGPSHSADPNGAISSTYTPQNGDPPGTYVIKAVGSQGTRAQANLVVTG